MPRIPAYGDRAGISGGATAPFVRSTGGEEVGAALKGVAGSVDQLATAQKEQNEKEEKIWATRLRADYAERMAKATARLDTVANVEAEREAFFKEVSETAPNPGALERARLIVDADTVPYISRAARKMAGATIARRGASFVDTLDAHKRAIYSDPALLESERKKAGAALSTMTGVLTPDAVARLKSKLPGELTEAAIRGFLDKKDFDSAEKLTNPDTGDLTFEGVVRMKALIERARRADGVEARIGLASTIPDLREIAIDTGSTEHVTSEISDKIMEAFGKTKGAAVLDEIKTAAVLGGDVKTLYESDPKARAALFAARVPEGEGYAGEKKRAAFLAAEAVKMDEALEKDGFRFVTTKTTDGKAAAGVLTDTEASIPARREALRTIVNEQLRLNGGRRDLVRTMSTDTADAYARKINEAEESAKIRDTLAAVDEIYGDHSEFAMRDLVKAGMNPALIAVPEMPDKVAAMALIEAAAFEKKHGRGAIRKEIKTIAKDVDSNYLVKMAGLRRTFPPGTKDTSGEYGAAVRLLSEYWAMKRGTDAAKSVTDAYDRVIGDRVVVSDTVRIPAHLPHEEIARGLQLKAPTLLRARAAEFDLSKIATRPGHRKEDKRKSYLESVLANGYWITAPDYSGVIRIGSNGVPVRTESGPLIIKWADLRKPLTEGDLTGLGAED